MSLPILRPILSKSPCRCLTPAHTLHTSSTLRAESQRKKSARLRKKAVLSQRESQASEYARTAPHPILGYHDPATWDRSVIKNLLLKREDIWGEPLRRREGREQETLDTASTFKQEELGTLDSIDLQGKKWNFGLRPQDAKLLFQDLPIVSAQKPMIVHNPARVGSEKMAALAGEAEATELEKRDHLMRAVDLKNANARGIRVENTRRVVEAFARKEGDTGSPEVQVAVLTLRIRNLASHLSQAKKDNSNARQLRAFISKRAKMFRYLKKKSADRYNAALQACGLEPRAVEGELLILEQDTKGLANLSL